MSCQLLLMMASPARWSPRSTISAPSLSIHGMNMILLGRLEELELHTRYIVTLRSTSLESRYHSIVVYAIDKEQEEAIPLIKDEDFDEKSLGRVGRQWFAMEEECPHLGASMAQADLEIEDDGVIAICPWHHYDFNLRTGESSTGLTACVLSTQAKEGKLYLAHPHGATDWTLISIRPVSQQFAIPSADSEEIENTILSLQRPSPKSLIEWGAVILRTSNPDLKVNMTRHVMGLFLKGDIPIFASSTVAKEFTLPPDTPTRESVRMVRPGDVAKRGKGGSLANRIKLLHALANIELWAIDLAWDIITRFSQERVNSKPLPRAFFTDFDEAKHFTLLRAALRRLGSDWGELPIHDGLWQSARDTSSSLISRLCIIHLVHEARGLDVNPTQIKRVKDAGDLETAKSLEIIHADEITHVAAGHRWLCFVCDNSVPQVHPVNVFRNEVKTHFFGKLKPPFNVEDRNKAGLDANFYQDL